MRVATSTVVASTTCSAGPASHTQLVARHVRLGGVPLPRSSNFGSMSRRHVCLASSFPDPVSTSSMEDLTPSDGEVVPLATQKLLPAASEKFGELKAFVAGGTGGTGKAIIERLVAEGVPVRALVRDAVKASSLLPDRDQGVEIISGDVYKYQTIPAAMKDCNVVLCATGPNNPLDPLGPFTIDYEGTKNLIAAAKQAGIKRFIYVTSIGADEILNPLNLIWGVLFWKKQAELELQRSGLEYTIVRPGGLRNVLRDGEKEGGVVMATGGTYGVSQGNAPPGSILRRQVADCCVEAAVDPNASSKVVEIISRSDAPKLPFEELFASVR